MNPIFFGRSMANQNKGIVNKGVGREVQYGHKGCKKYGSLVTQHNYEIMEAFLVFAKTVEQQFTHFSTTSKIESIWSVFKVQI